MELDSAFSGLQYTAENRSRRLLVLVLIPDVLFLLRRNERENHISPKGFPRNYLSALILAGTCMLTKYGLDVAIPILVVSLLLAVAGILFNNPVLKWVLIPIGAFFFLFTAYFFRDPERTVPTNPAAVVAPADGKVIAIKEVEENEYFHTTVRQVSIFMSPLNVHVNRYPISGTIDYFRHVEGRYFVAFEDKASEANERTLIGITNGSHKILFKQIAGFIARRIVCPLREGLPAKMGERFGMIKFGSRVDIFLPLNAELHVSLNATTVAGETILAVLK
jgi:phosphatidylserine decarboxylase